MLCNFCPQSFGMVSLTSIELLLQVLDMGVSSNDVIIISIFFLLKINIKLQSLYCLLFLRIED